MHSYSLILAIIYPLHLNSPLSPPCPALNPGLLLRQIQWPTLTRTRVWPSLPIHLPTLTPITFLKGKSNRLWRFPGYSHHLQLLSMALRALWKVTLTCLSSFGAHTMVQAHQLPSTIPRHSKHSPVIHIVSSMYYRPSHPEVNSYLFFKVWLKWHLLQGLFRWELSLPPPEFFVHIWHACVIPVCLSLHVNSKVW